MSSAPGARCSDLSRAAGEPLVATAATTERWLLVEVPGSWPRDVSVEGALPANAHDAVTSWLARTPRSRLLFLRRPGRTGERPLVFTVRSEEMGRETRRIEIEQHADLAEVDLDVEGEPVDAPLVLVCGHGSRDSCCALRGTGVFGALANGLGDEQIWISSHQGGHRFAGNVLVLPTGLQLGRVDENDAVLVATRALQGRIEPAHYRGRTFYERAVQAAEHAVRESACLDGVDDLRLVSVDDSVVRFRARDGAEHAALVEETEGPLVPASCGAEPEPQTVFRARLV